MLIDSRGKAYSDFLHRLAEQEIIAYDVETSGLKIWHGDKICGAAIGFEDGSVFYLPIRHATFVPEVTFVKEGRRTIRHQSRDALVAHEFDQLDPADLHEVWNVIRTNGIEVIMHNSKFDAHMTINEGISLDGIMIFDTMVMAKIANNIEISVALKRLGAKYLGVGEDAEEKALKATMKARGWTYKNERGDTIMHFDWFTPAEMAPYATKDVDLTMRLYAFFLKKIVASGQQQVWHRENALLPVLIDMERRGIRIDVAYTKQTLETAMSRLSDVADQIYAIAGCEFNIQSTPDSAAVFKRLGMRSEVQTEKGAESWAKKALLANDHPLVALVIEWRGLAKTISTYLVNFIEFADQDGIIHADIQQCEAVTGRTSYRSPNLQNVSIGEKQGINLRRCFVPRPGHVFVMVDYKTMEARIAANASGETVLIDAINAGMDVHSLTAGRIAAARGVEYCGDILTCPSAAKQRKDGKTVFFGLLYGLGSKKLAAQLGLDPEGGTAMRDAFWATYPKLAAWFQSVKNTAKNTGQVRNKYGRVYLFSMGINVETGRAERQFCYAAVDYVAQGTGADMAKIVMAKIHNALIAAGMKSRIALFVHDEVVLEVPFAEIDRAVRGCTKHMIEPFAKDFKVAIEVDVAVSRTSWAEEEPYQKKGLKELVIAQ